VGLVRGRGGGRASYSHFDVGHSGWGGGARSGGVA
jgi:hypothetical protein